MDATMLARILVAIVAFVAIFGSLSVIKLLSSTTKSVKEEELGQTRQGDDYDGD